jgi:DNA polymerase delta subunit 1
MKENQKNSGNSNTKAAEQMEEAAPKGRNQMTSSADFVIPEAWKRKERRNLNPTNDSLLFQQIEVEETTVTLNHGNARTEQIKKIYADSGSLAKEHLKNIQALPMIRMFGVTEEGNSVLCNVHGFFPYFYLPCPSANFTEDDCEQLAKSLNGSISPNSTEPSVLKVEVVKKKTIYGFYGSSFKPFLKITTLLHKYLNKVKGLLENGYVLNGQRFNLSPAFESNISYTLRFMIDCAVVGANWVELPKAKWCKLGDNCQPESFCQWEVDVVASDLISHSTEGEYSKVAPLRVLSFDIECAGRKGVFPEASVDPVIQIANIVTVQGSKQPHLVKNIFTLKSCGHIVGADIFSFEDEGEMLMQWSNFIRTVDPDVITGYNVNNFDFPYLLDRAEALGVKGFPYLGRFRNSRTVAKDTRFSSKAYGTRDNKETNLDGRLPVDMLQVIQRDHKLRSYTLNSVSAHFLGEQKEDVPHSIITDLQNGDEQTRRRLAVYCLKDAYLPQRLMTKLMVLINMIEMARVTGIPFNYLLTRGQQIKVISQLFRKAKEEDLIVPVMHSEGTDEQYEGATVIEPKRGFYPDCIATLDFASLYPSIMMAHNLCYSTVILNNVVIEQLNLKKDEDYIITPSGDKFVKPHVAKGVLPTILEDLLSARKKAKKDLKNETDPFKRAVLDGRQLALKISANSVYGFTGATIGKLPCLQVSQSVTAFGRQMIEFTKETVESQYTKANGFDEDAEVIYGDTDSVMVRFKTNDLSKAMALGQEAAKFITEKFVKPINLEFEKVYWPYLLINKKRYAGLYWSKVENYDKMDTKGIETVRRDNCRLVQTVIETCLRKILIEKDVDGAINFTKSVIADLLQNKVDLSQLVISKQLSKSGDDYTAKQPHAELAERMRKRDAGSAPALGDRVAYVIIRGAKGARAWEKAEDPIYVLENNIPIDTKYYLDNQLKNPLLRIFEPILKNAESELFAGQHTLTVSVAAPSVGGLMKFAVKRSTCLGCKAGLKDHEKENAICQYCTPRVSEIYQKHLLSYQNAEAKFDRLWTQCQRCQGSLCQDVLCTSRDCPIFYMRKKAQKEAQETLATLDRFGSGYGEWNQRNAPDFEEW